MFPLRFTLILLTATALLSILLLSQVDMFKRYHTESDKPLVRQTLNPQKIGKKKTQDERRLFSEARLLHEFYLQANPQTGTISKQEKQSEMEQAERALVPTGRSAFINFSKRGPGNLGGRTRAIVVDLSDPTGNTLLAGAVSGGVFRTTDGGASWTKVSANDEIHNVTTIVQDPRPGFQNIWYYGTGEASGNSASAPGAFYLGRGVFQSTDGGLNWTQVAGTNSVQVNFDSRFDIVNRLAVSPVNGELYAAITGRISRFDGTNWNTEINNSSAATTRLTDILFTSTGRAYAAFSGNCDAGIQGVWTSATGNGGWVRIAQNGNPGAWNSVGRCVLGQAPSNSNIVYALYVDAAGGTEADLWRWNLATTSWTNFSAKVPDEPGGLAGNDPFAVQGGYDLVVAAKPDDQDFVVIGGTNVYSINDINTDPQFERIGGYDGPNTYALWNNGGGAVHHPDIHALVFDPFSPETLYSGTDGGVHRTNSISTTTAANTPWTNLNNDYQSYQYYRVYLDQLNGSNRVIGGAQDNGTTVGGTNFGFANNTDHQTVFSGDGAACAISRDDACVPFFMTTQNGNMVRDCPTFTTITPAGSASQFVTYFHMDPDNNATIYYAGQNTIYRTNNSTTVTANTWTNMGNTGNIGLTDFFQTFETTRGTYNPSSSYLLAGGDEGHIFRLDDPQNNNFNAAVDITPAGASTVFPSVVSGLSIHPTNPDIAMAVYSNYGIPSIYVTSNARAANPVWTLVERNLSAHSIRSCVIAESNGQTFYVVGTARGLYSTTDPLSIDWSRLATNTIGFALVSSISYRPSDNMLLIGTHGNGMFITTLDNTLSVDEILLSGEYKQSDVHLNWTTLNENNNDFFEIQRSSDGVLFQTIDQLSSKGNSQGYQSYDYIDPSAENTIQYYRLRLIDKNGNQRISNVIAVEIADSQNQLVQVYPNPIEDQMIIELPFSANEKASLELYSLDGKLALQRMVPLNERLINVNLADQINSGMYTLTLTLNERVITSQKIIKK